MSAPFASNSANAAEPQPLPFDTGIRDADFSIWGWLKPYLPKLGIVALCLCGLISYTAGLPVGLSYLIDKALPEKDVGTMSWVFGFFGAGLIIYITAGLVQDYWMSRISAGLICDLRLRMFRHLQSLSANYFAGSSEADILSRFSGDLANVEGVAGSLSNWVGVPVLQVLVNLVLLFTLDWRLALLAMLVFPVGLIAPKVFAGKAVRTNDAKKDQEAELVNQVQENVAVQSVIRTFSLTGTLMNLFSQGNSQLLERTTAMRRAGFAVERSTGIGIAALQVLVLAIGAILVYRDVLSAGKLVAFQSLFFLMCDNLFFLMQNVPQLLQALSGLRRVEELLQTPIAVEDLPGAKTLAPLQEAITMSHVSFSYDGEHAAVKDISLRVPRGTTVAIVGPNGCGKTTVLLLLLRLYDPQEGEIRFDGRELRSASQNSLRKQMSSVLQESVLFNTTIRENVRIGRPDATEMEFAVAGSIADIDEAIHTLTHGLDTPVGLRGSRVSGGVRQRVAIARAVLCNAPILLLDEPTAALDVSGEASVNSKLAEYWKGKTVIAATQRLANIQQFDRIFVLDKGQLVEEGQHADLLAQRGLYARMWQKQTGFVLQADEVKVEASRLRDIPLLSRLSDDMLEKISSLFETENVPADRTIVKEGDHGDKFYIIVRGRAEAFRDLPDGTRKRFTVMSDGDVFGEMALLKDTPRTASVQTLAPSVFLTLARKHFLEILEHAPGVREDLEAVLAKRQ